MLSYTQVLEYAQEASKEAQEEERSPLSILGFDCTQPAKFIRSIPFLGDYIPLGWEAVESIEPLFVDSSGLGGNNEPALSVNQFIDKLEAFAASRDNYGFGIIEAGEFQVYIQVYRPDSNDFTHTGLLNHKELNTLG